MEKTLRKFIITGGPSSGKTCLINELKKEFLTFGEVAREVLRHKKFSEESQYEIFKKQLYQSREADNFKEIIFFDRGIPDALAYFKHHNFKTPGELLNESKPASTKYELIFYLTPVLHIPDDIRKESRQETEKIHRKIYETYDRLDYKIIKVPLMSIKKRAEFIKSFL